MLISMGTYTQITLLLKIYFVLFNYVYVCAYVCVCAGACQGWRMP